MDGEQPSCSMLDRCDMIGKQENLEEGKIQDHEMVDFDFAGENTLIQPEDGTFLLPQQGSYSIKPDISLLPSERCSKIEDANEAERIVMPNVDICVRTGDQHINFQNGQQNALADARVNPDKMRLMKVKSEVDETYDAIEVTCDAVDDSGAALPWSDDPKSGDDMEYNAINRKQKSEDSVGGENNESFGVTELACEFCRKTFFDKPSLKRHKRTHAGEKRFRCEECGKTFSQQTHLKNHVRIHTGEKPYECSICKKAFRQLSTKIEHERIHKKVCAVCKQIFINSASLKLHMKTTHTGENPYRCEEYGEIFSRRTDLKSRFKIHSSVEFCATSMEQKPNDSVRGVNNESCDNDSVVSIDNQNNCEFVCDATHALKSFSRRSRRQAQKTAFSFKCTNCELSFECQSDLVCHTSDCHSMRKSDKRHLRGKRLPRPISLQSQKAIKQTKKGPFKCDVCDIEFSFLKHARKHMKKHKKHGLIDSNKTYKCDECGKAFFHSGNLKRHRLAHSVIKRHTCQFCGKGFHQKSNLVSHMEVHSRPNNRTHQCKTCGKFYKNERYLQIHQKIHSGVIEFACEVCNKAFIDNPSLKQHMRTHTGEKPYICDECGRAFSQHEHLKSHIRIHTGEKPYECSICKKAFRQLSTRIEHERIHKKICEFCKLTFIDRTSLKLHMQTHIGKEPYICEECGKIFSQRSHLKRHARTHAGVEHYVTSVELKSHDSVEEVGNDPVVADDLDKHCESACDSTPSLQSFSTRQTPVTVVSFKCRNCALLFRSRSDLASHATDCHSVNESDRQFLCETSGQHFPLPSSAHADKVIKQGEKSQFKCNFCDTEFSCLSQVKEHIKKHIQPEPIKNYKCDDCGQAFVYSSNLSRHRLTHSLTKSHICQVCDKGFHQKSNLLSHMKVHSRPSKTLMTSGGFGESKYPKRFFCNICEKGFPFQSSLNKHIETIHSNITHQCETCGKVYKNERYLQIHLKIHSGILEFSCEICKKGFIDNPSLKLHMRTHNGEKPYICEECGKTFSQHSHLKNHIRIHTGEKPYECSICKKAFRQLSTRIEHERIHKKVCAICKQTFINRASLKLHMKTHTGDKPFRCGDCGETFGQEFQLKRHVKIHVIEEEEDCLINVEQDSNDAVGGVESESTHNDSVVASDLQKNNGLVFGNSHSLQSFSARQTPVTVVSFKCTNCELLFKSQSDLACHATDCLSMQQSDKQYLSETTGLHVSLPSSLQVHNVGQDADEGPFKCNFCGIEFSLLKQLKEHIHKHSLPEFVKKYECDAHEQTFHSISNVSHPELTHSVNKSHTCQVCGKGFHQKSKLRSHLKIHDLDNKNVMEIGGGSGKCRYPIRFICSFCGNGFTFRSSLNRHIAAIHSNITYQCTTCGKVYKSKRCLQIHLKIHGGVIFTCRFCKNSFNDHPSLKLHMRTHDGERLYRCEDCGKAFARPEHLKSHVRIHTGEKPFECSICRKAFRQLSTRIEHERTHKKVCEVCKETFVDKFSLKLHMRTHTGERLYICDECGETFSQPSHFRNHVKVHTEEKPREYKIRKIACRQSIARIECEKTRDKVCEVCQKSFMESNSLKIHMRTHTGERPYICEECGKSFAQHAHLRSHIRIHTGEKPYECSICKKAFRQLSTKLEHEKIH